jgi:hypothetical protein
MQLDQEIDSIFKRLNNDLVSVDVAVSAIEQLISTHVRKPTSQLDASIRSTIADMYSRGADLEAIQAGSRHGSISVRTPTIGSSSGFNRCDQPTRAVAPPFPSRPGGQHEHNLNFPGTTHSAAPR